MKSDELEANIYSQEYAEFITVTCLEWKLMPLLVFLTNKRAQVDNRF